MRGRLTDAASTGPRMGELEKIGTILPPLFTAPRAKAKAPRIPHCPGQSANDVSETGFVCVLSGLEILGAKDPSLGGFVFGWRFFRETTEVCK